MGLLHKLIEFGVPKKDLILIYTLFIRSICEQSAVVWHSSLTQENRNNIERVQKTALKIILRNEYKTYESALVEVNLKNLDTRRETLCLNFAKSCLKNIQTKNKPTAQLCEGQTANPCKIFSRKIPSKLCY